MFSDSTIIRRGQRTAVGCTGITDSMNVVLILGDGDHVGVEAHKVHVASDEIVEIWERELTMKDKEQARWRERVKWRGGQARQV